MQEAKQSLGGLQNARAGLDLSVSKACQQYSAVSTYIAHRREAASVASQAASHLQELAEDRPAGKSSAAKAAASKSTQQLADTIGESDISDEEDWLTEPAETSKPSDPIGAPSTDTAAASFAPSSLATGGQPAFQDEDDYDADEDATAAPATHSQALCVTTQAALTTPAASAAPAAPAGVHGISAGLPPTAGLHAAVQPTASAASDLASLPLPTPPVPAITAPQPAAQAAIPMTQQDRRRKAFSLQQQVCCSYATGYPTTLPSTPQPQHEPLIVLHPSMDCISHILVVQV